MPRKYSVAIVQPKNAKKLNRKWGWMINGYHKMVASGSSGEGFNW